MPVSLNCAAAAAIPLSAAPGFSGALPSMRQKTVAMASGVKVILAWASS